jgi:hypothetical protein
MIADDDGAADNIGTLCVFQPTYPRLETVKRFIGQLLDHVPDITNKQTQKQTLSFTRHYDRRI